MTSAAAPPTTPPPSLWPAAKPRPKPSRPRIPGIFLKVPRTSPRCWPRFVRGEGSRRWRDSTLDIRPSTFGARLGLDVEGRVSSVESNPKPILAQRFADRDYRFWGTLTTPD